MIISASRRTDIPAFYSKWFMNRIREGYVMVRNPMNYNSISKISLDPSLVDCIVFWTKNPLPMFEYLEEIEKRYMFYFQYTLNPYGNDVEPNIATLDEKIKTFISLSKKIGKERVIWRYDPIVITKKYTKEWHIANFEYICEKISKYTNACVFSYVDYYNKITNNLKLIGTENIDVDTIDFIAEKFSLVAKKHNIILKTCSEEIDLQKYDIEHSCCIDPVLMAKLLNCNLITKKDANQRSICGCVESIDIGQYNTCLHGCKYCYANYSFNNAINNHKLHKEDSPLLLGEIESSDKITERKVKSLKDFRISLF